MLTLTKIICYICFMLGTIGLVYYGLLIHMGTKMGIVDWTSEKVSFQNQDHREIKWRLVFILCGVAMGIIVYPSVHYGALVMLGLWMLRRTVLKKQMSRQEQYFTCNAYKIYRYMAIQFSAGVHVSDVMKTLHLSVNDVAMKKALKAFSGAYYQTLNFEMASKELTHFYSNQEMVILLTLIDQGLKAGNPYEMVKRQERLMIRKYFNALSLSSQWIKTKGAILAVLLSLMIFILLALPMLYEMKNATRMIFT